MIPFNLIPFNWAVACWPGSQTLPPVLCVSYTGSPAGTRLSNFRWFSPLFGSIDAPEYLPAGSHHSSTTSPLVRPGVIYASATLRESPR